MFTAAKLFESFLGIPMIASILVISLLTVTYTALGGLKAVVVTETIQIFLLLGQRGPGHGPVDRAPAVDGHPRHGRLQGPMKPDQLNMVQSIVGPDGNLREFSWLGVVLGFPILGIWYWCTDQTHVQRVLGAKSEKHGQNGALFAGFLKLLPVFLMVFPGTVGYIMFRKGEMNLGSDRQARLQPAAGADDPEARAGGAQGPGGGRHGGGLDELHGRGVEQLCDADFRRYRQADCGPAWPTPAW